MKDGHGYLPASDDKPVMPCIHLAPDQNMDSFYLYLKENGVKMLSEIKTSEVFGQVFLVEDPGGYIVEFVKRNHE